MKSGILSAVYVIGLLACLIVGTIKGPNVFEKSPPAAVETNNLNVTWYGKIDGMERWHQVGQATFSRDVLKMKNRFFMYSIYRTIY